MLVAKDSLKSVFKRAATVLGTAALFILFSTAGVGARAHQSPKPRGGGQSAETFFVTIRVDGNASRAKALSRYDIAGTNWRKKTVQLLVTRVEMEELRRQGFELSPAIPFSAIQQGPQGYTRPEHVHPKLLALAEKYPQLMTVFSAGKSVQQREIYGVVIGVNNGRIDKPYVMLNAMHHAREVMTTEVVLHAIEQLVAGYGTDSEVTSWLEQLNVVAIPQVNPDGNNIVHTDYGGWRKNAYERFRVVGVDLNRNYPTMWGACGGSSGARENQTYRGPSAASEPETKAIMSLFEKYKPVANISYHSFGELILFPFGCDDVANPAFDTFFKVATSMGRELLNDEGVPARYSIGVGPEILYVTDGTDNDWQWAEHGVLAYTIEVNAEEQNFQPDFAKWRNVTVERQVGGWKQLLRRVVDSSVKGRVQSSRYDVANISYTVTHLTAAGPKKWNNGLVKAFKLKNAQGLFYQVVAAGRYQFDFFAQGGLIGTKTVQVVDGQVDLGTIQF